MARIEGNLWEHNFARVHVLDVSDDYELMREPLPTCCYPVIAEMWVPRWRLPDGLPKQSLAPGYLYDWHDCPDPILDEWFVGVVREELVQQLTMQYGVQ